jgi:O-antigen ligase
MTLGLGLVGLLWGIADVRLRRAAWVAVVTGVVAFVLGGASAGVIGLVPAAILAVVIAMRRRRPFARRTLAALLAATAVASLGVVSLRAGDFDQFFRFLGAKPAEATTTTNIQTYSQRTLLGYIGLRIWLHHPVVGVGWQGSSEPSAFTRELPAAHRRFTDVAPSAFPSSTRRYGVQVLYVQLLADLGIIGLVLFLGLAGAGLVTGLKGALGAAPLPAFASTLGLFWLVLALGLWTAEGLIAGLPIDALTWLGFGLVTVRQIDTA